MRAWCEWAPPPSPHTTDTASDRLSLAHDPHLQGLTAHRRQTESAQSDDPSDRSSTKRWPVRHKLHKAMTRQAEAAQSDDPSDTNCTKRWPVRHKMHKAMTPQTQTAQSDDPSDTNCTKRWPIRHKLHKAMTRQTEAAQSDDPSDRSCTKRWPVRQKLHKAMTRYSCRPKAASSWRLRAQRGRSLREQLALWSPEAEAELMKLHECWHPCPAKLHVFHAHGGTYLTSITLIVLPTDLQLHKQT